MKKLFKTVSILAILAVLFTSFSLVSTEAKTIRLKKPVVSNIKATSTSISFNVKIKGSAKAYKSVKIQKREQTSNNRWTKWKQVKSSSIKKNKKKYTLNSLSPSKKYQIRVKLIAKKGYKSSKYSKAKTVTTKTQSKNQKNDNKSSDNSNKKPIPTNDRVSLSNTNAEAVLKLVNQERKKRGLNSLKLSSELNQVAFTKAKDMAVNNYFSHQSAKYGSPFQMLSSFGISYSAAGENIAAGQPTPKEVMNSWMNSPGHRANILNENYTELGVGYYMGGGYGCYWTQIFIG